ncbi:HlyD family efflux transporter periplasmic adaptor subunit [Actinoplanes sp. NPDC020271]|uniref:HlyD family efflux transporter periplasmic adaptor subunit n=1 Tax=Actinoplanes sp. NPDC020271 TaxID=3363896 RepID=UPI0037AFFBC5
MSRRAVALAVAVTAPLAAGVAWAVHSEPSAPSVAAAGIATGTATAHRGRLTQTTQVSGELGWSGSYSIDHQGRPGILTASAAPDATIGRGQILYRVADHPVRLLLGVVPAFRDLAYGVSDGPDVGQLERNLAAMGFDPDHRMTVDRHFSAATAAAIRRWEASQGRPSWQRTGRLTQGDVVFLPVPVRITDRESRVGTAVSPGSTVLTATSTARAVIAQVDTSELGAIHVGDRVGVALPDADPIPGRVTEIGPAASVPAGDRDGPPDANAATVPVTVAVRPPRGVTLGAAPVTVDITTRTREGVLLVPIAALLARPGGGYQVRLAGGASAPVEPGWFDEAGGQVEILDGLAEGQTVEVPAT